MIKIGKRFKKIQKNVLLKPLYKIVIANFQVNNKQNKVKNNYPKEKYKYKTSAFQRSQNYYRI